MTEFWKEVRDHPKYEVSNIGRVRNKKTGKMLSQSLNHPNGYMRVGLDRKHYYVHRLVADSFYDGDHTKMDVNHIDGNKLNNELPNLEWTMKKDNIEHEVIRVVRCKFCRHWNESSFCKGRPDDFYCADGEV